MAIVYEEKRTQTPIGQVIYGYKTPVSSSDVNESLYITNKNIVDYIIGVLQDDSFKLYISDISKNTPGLTDIVEFKYIVKDSLGNYYIGAINTPVQLTLNNPTANKEYDVYAFSRATLLDKDSVIYLDGIRTNPLQGSIVESEVPNNIGDLHIESIETGRYALEFTFVVVDKNAIAPELDDWEYRTKASTIKLNSSMIPETVTNQDVPINEETVNYITNIVNQSLNEAKQYTDTKVSNYVTTNVINKLTQPGIKSVSVTKNDSAWIASGQFFYRDFTVSGLKTTDVPYISLDLQGVTTTDAVKNIRKDYANFTEYECVSANTLRIFTLQKPAVAFNLSVDKVGL